MQLASLHSHRAGALQELNEVFLPQIRTPAPARTAQDRAAVMKKIQVIYQDWASAGRCAYLGAVQRRGRTPPKRKPCRPLAHPRRHYQPTLTARETEVLALIAQGMTSKEIARSLGIDFRTVDAHRANIRNRFHLESSAALLRFAIDASKS